MIRCLICERAETIHGLTAVHLERGEMKFVIGSVPAQVCPNCGEAYVDETVAERLLQHAEQTLIGGVLNEYQEYDSLK